MGQNHVPKNVDVDRHFQASWAVTFSLWAMMIINLNLNLSFTANGLLVKIMNCHVAHPLIFRLYFTKIAKQSHSNFLITCQYCCIQKSHLPLFDFPLNSGQLNMGVCVCGREKRRKNGFRWLSYINALASWTSVDVRLCNLIGCSITVVLRYRKQCRRVGRDTWRCKPTISVHKLKRPFPRTVM